MQAGPDPDGSPGPRTRPADGPVRLGGGVLEAPGFVIAEWRDPGGPPDPPRLIAPLHVHDADDEAWYVLDGALRFITGDDEVEAGAGQALVVSRGTPHTFWNPRATPTRYLIVMTPRIHRLIQALHRQPLDGDAMRRVFEQHQSRLLP